MMTETTPIRKLLQLLTCVPLAAAMGCGGGSEQSQSPDYPQAEPTGQSMPPAAAGEQPAQSTQPAQPEAQPEEQEPGEVPPAGGPGAQPSGQPAAPSGGGDPYGSSTQGAPSAPQAGTAPRGAAGGASNVDDQELTQFAQTYAEVITVQQEHQQEAQQAASRDQLQSIQTSMEEDIQDIIKDSPLSRSRFDTIAKAVSQDDNLRSRFEQKMQALQ